MIKIILRQIGKHWRGLLPVTIVWIVAGYLIFSSDHDMLRSLFPPQPGVERGVTTNKHTIFREISSWFTTFPEPGEQWPDRAYSDYIGPALDLIHDDRGLAICELPSHRSRCKPQTNPTIHLRLMEQACAESGQILRSGFDPYQDDWLTEIRRWSLSSRDLPGDSPEIVHGGDYWNSHRDNVYEALRLAVSGMRYAYEIPDEIHMLEGVEKPILVPELVDVLARAACKRDMGTLSWGEYADFLETRAYRRLTTSPLMETERERYLYPQEKEVLLLEELRANRHYLTALEQYGSGPVPDPFSSACEGNTFLLACYAPLEAEKVYNRRLYFSTDRRSPPLYVALARIQLRIALFLDPGSSQVQTERESDRIQSALDYLSGATRHSSTEVDARKLATRIHLFREDFRLAYDQLTQLSLIMRNYGRNDPVFRKLARLTLLGLGRPGEADCFADIPEMVTGVRAGCDDVLTPADR